MSTFAHHWVTAAVAMLPDIIGALVIGGCAGLVCAVIDRRRREPHTEYPTGRTSGRTSEYAERADVVAGGHHLVEDTEGWHQHCDEALTLVRDPRSGRVVDVFFDDTAHDTAHDDPAVVAWATDNVVRFPRQRQAGELS